MKILVFKTNIKSKEQTKEVSHLLNAIPAVENFNFDLEDCDKILRIVANDRFPRPIETLLAEVGIECKELEY